MTTLAIHIVNRPTTFTCDCQIGNVYAPNRQIRFHLNPTTKSLTISIHDIQNNVVNPAVICRLTPANVTYEERDSNANPKLLSRITFERQCAILCRITEKNICDAIVSPHSKNILSIAILV